MHSKDAIRIQVVIPFAQPLTASDADMEAATRRCYVPLLDALERAENLRLSLHFNGHLLDYMARHQEGFMLRLKALMKRGQVEILGGLFYGGIPALVPEADLRGQIEMACEFWDSYVGIVPQGFWLPDLAFTAELPRLLHETGMAYGFIADTQLQLGHGRHPQPGLGVLERGGHAVGAFVLNQELSDALPSTPAGPWLAAAATAGQASRHRLLSVWVRAESLGLEPDTDVWVHTDGWLEKFFAGLADGKNFVPVLPGDTYPSIRPSVSLRLGNVRAPELRQMAAADQVTDWSDYPYLFAEVDTLYRRMLRASRRLRGAIAMMEDEGLEERWSDKLATAQRLVFASQSPDAYWRGVRPGFSDPALREATLARIVRAESLMDSLLHPESAGGWLEVQQEDWDGDLCEEVFVSTPYLVAWLVPAHGGDLRCLDDRARERNILDAGSRRIEPFFGPLAKGATLLPTPAHPPRRGEVRPARPSRKKLPMTADKVERCGMRQWIVERSVTPHELLTGAAADLKPHTIAWDVLRNGIDEADDLNYTLAQIGGFPLKGPGKRQLEMQRETQVPNNRAKVMTACRLSMSRGEPVRWGLEIPVRLAGGGMRMWVDGHEAELTQHTFENVRQVRLAATDGELLTLEIEGEDRQAVDLWCLPLTTTIQDLGGYAAVTQGIVLMPTLLLQGEASVRVHLGVAAQDHH
jgi:hypothetical protein